MHEKIEEKLAPVKKFVVKHKTAIAVIGTAVTCLAINRLALKQHDDFLMKKGLYDEYYTPEDE